MRSNVDAQGAMSKEISTDSLLIRLLFYRRIFPVREIRLVLHVATAAVIAYFIGSLLPSVFQWYVLLSPHGYIAMTNCSHSLPVHKFWHRTVPGHCLNGDTLIIVPGAVNVVLDFFIVALVRANYYGQT